MNSPSSHDHVQQIIDTARQEELGESDLRFVVASGYFDPIHPGHISYLRASKDIANDKHAKLVVVVNGDEAACAKKGAAFMPIEDRLDVVRSIRYVDYVMPLSGSQYNTDPTVKDALRMLRPCIFTKGGDRKDAKSIPEWDLCDELGIHIQTGVGADKAWSSSDYLSEWIKHKTEEKA